MMSFSKCANSQADHIVWVGICRLTRIYNLHRIFVWALKVSGSIEVCWVVSPT